MDDKFYYPNKSLLPMDSLKFEEVLLKTDTVQLSGFLFKPKSKVKSTIIFFHGAGGNVSRYLFMTKPLIDAGYQVFMIDFRGYGKSTGTPTHLNIARDGQFVLNYLLDREDIKKTKIILYGASIGSQIATKLVKDNPGKIAALVLDGAISSFTDIAADQSLEAQRLMIRKFLPSPYAAKEDIKFSGNIPKLFIHSKEDKDVPFQEGEMVYHNATGPKEFYIYQGKHLEGMKSNSKENNKTYPLDQVLRMKKHQFNNAKMTTAGLENLKFPLGKFKMPEQRTASFLNDQINSLSAFPGKLKKEVAHLNETQLDTPYRLEGWTIRQVVHHCADSHLNSFIRFKLALTEDNPVIKPYFEDRWAELPDSLLLPVAPSISLLESLHERWVFLLRALTTEQWQKSFIHPEQEEKISLIKNIAIYAWHGNHHLAHITRLKERNNWT